MDESYDSVSLSPTQLLGRLQQLRLLQEAAREKLQRQRQLHPPTSSDTVGSYQELLPHFSTDSSSYRTFQNLLLDSNNEPFEYLSSRTIDDTTDVSRRSSNRIRPDELIDGIGVLNLSQESQCVLASSSSGNNLDATPQQEIIAERPTQSNLKKFIELEEMPILSPRRDFESLVLEKIHKEKTNNKTSSTSINITKKTFLKRGEGLSRFGMKKDDLVIQNTKSLPWKKRSLNKTQNSNPHHVSRGTKSECYSKSKEKVVEVFSGQSSTSTEAIPESQTKSSVNPLMPQKKKAKVIFAEPNETNSCPITEPKKNVEETTDIKLKEPPPRKITKTWAAILTQEQDEFLRQLKQSSYYKNFESPAKSIVSEVSCNESFHQLQQEREIAEQNIFELLENKVSNASFCSESSFLHRFIRNKGDCSGDNTPMLLQRCIANNPHLLQLFPPPKLQKETVDTRYQVEEQTIEETCESVCTECDHEICSNTSTCCTCRTVEETNASMQTSTPHTIDVKDDKKPDNFKSKDNDNLDQTVTATDAIKADMTEMNAKLVSTTDLLKERLHELEDEIEMFRQENVNLTKLREDIDAERQRFHEEKSAYEQKMNEDKVLSEYYLAEEREKLAKQKQVYERYVREMKGRLNKKEKDEVIKLKKEMEDLKEEFRQKDARSTSCIARLRNQLKIMEKEKKDFREECEKLKKENRRIQHVNTNTRRLSNLKYLAEINKKLSLIDTTDKMAPVIPDDDAKYKSRDIENRARVQKLLPTLNQQLRVRAKSVPNLTVTSRYAKYFSQRDAMSHIEQDRVTKHLDNDISVHSDYSSDIDYKTLRNYERTLSNRSNTESKDGETDCTSEISAQTVKSKYQTDARVRDESVKLQYGHKDGQQSTESPPSTYNPSVSSRTSNKSKSPIPSLDLARCGSSTTLNRSKSPISILSNRSSMGSHKSSGIHEQNSPVNEIYRQQSADSSHNQSNEERLSRESVTQTNLNPTEIKRADGSRELRFPNGNVKIISGDGKTSKFMYYNGDIKETFYDDGKVKYYYAETKTYHTTYVDGLELLQFPDGQVEKRYADGSVEIRLPNGSVRYTDPRNEHVSEEWRFPDGSVLSVSRDGEQVVRFPNGQVEVHAKDHKRREFPDGTVKLVYSDGTSETRYASGRVRIKDAQGVLVMDSATSR